MNSNDLDLLFRLRLAVARVGESDNARWWASDGVLGKDGQYVYGRLAPRTAPLARARVAFAVARSRCAERVSTLGAVTLWSLPATLEEAFEDRWSHWADHLDDWEDTFTAIEDVSASDVVDPLLALGLIEEHHAAEARALDAASSATSVQLDADALDADALRRLAAAFACGRPSALVVPFYRPAS